MLVYRQNVEIKNKAVFSFTLGHDRWWCPEAVLMQATAEEIRQWTPRLHVDWQGGGWCQQQLSWPGMGFHLQGQRGVSASRSKKFPSSSNIFVLTDGFNCMCIIFVDSFYLPYCWFVVCFQTYRPLAISSVVHMHLQNQGVPCFGAWREASLRLSLPTHLSTVLKPCSSHRKLFTNPSIHFLICVDLTHKPP